MSRFNQLSTRPLENPAVVVLHHAQKQKVSRAPMVNPYDKFTQPEFDAWIGDITSALRRALGVEQEEPRLLENIRVSGDANGNSLQYHQLDLSDQDEVPDDSFAQIKTRRDKGKARDPREGPGLGKDRTQPIEVVSSDEEEEAEVEDLAFSLRDDDSDLYDQSEDAESDYSWERSSPSNHLLPPGIGPPSRSRQQGIVEESNTGSDDGEEDEYEGDDDSVERANDDSEVITISDEDESIDDEDENHPELDYHGRPGPSSLRYPGDDSSKEDEVQGDNGEEIDEIQPLDDDTSFPPQLSSLHHNLELNDPWEAPRRYAEDLYSGGELRLPAGAQVYPDHLSTLDESIELSRPYEVDQYVETPSNLRPTSEDYISDGNIITPHFDPRFFSRAEDEDIGMDSFLTPGVLIPNPNQSELCTHLDEAGDRVEPGFIQPLSHSILTSSPKRNEPIPLDAEIIAVDDSDDDEDKEDSLEVILPLDAILEMFAARHPEKPEVEDSQTKYSTSFVPLVENIDNGGEDGALSLSVHRAYTQVIGLENHLQPFEIVEPESADSNAAQGSLSMTFDVGPVPPEAYELEVEEQNNPGVIETIEPGVMLLGPVQDISLDAGPKSITVDEQEPNHYENFDDIYATPVPETLPPDASEERHLQPGGLVTLFGSQTMAHEEAKFETEATNNMALRDVEVVERSQDSSLAALEGTKVNDNVDISSLGGQSLHWPENNGVAPNEILPESTMEKNLQETSRDGVISVDEHPRGPATPNSFRNAVSTLGLPKPEEPLPKTPGFTTKGLPVMLSPSRTSTIPGRPQIPMPVMADANVPDPTESPIRLQEHPILSIPATPDIVITSLQTPQIAQELAPTSQSLLLERLHSFTPRADGLFTPADFSTATTPEDSAVTMLPSRRHEADVETVAPVDLLGHAELTDKTASSLKEGVADVFTEINNISSQRTSILMTDPYPYCLSTPTVPMLDDGSSEENDGNNSISSNSTAEKEGETAEAQFTFPLAADIEPHINSQPETTEPEDTFAPLTKAKVDCQAVAASSQDLLEDPKVEELGASPTLEEKDTLQYPTEPTTKLEDIPYTSVEEQITQPLGADADLQARVRDIDGSILRDLHASFSAFYDLHLPQPHEQVEQAKQDSIPQVTNAVLPASRSSKRKRGTSDPNDSDDFSVKIKGKLRARSKGKQGGKEAETGVSVVEHDTIHVRPRTSLKHRAATLEQNSAKIQTSFADVPEFSKAEGTRPPDPQPKFNAPPLFHAHGRAKRQKAQFQPVVTVKQTRDHEDQAAAESATQGTSIPEKPPLPSGASRDPSSPLGESVLPMAAEAVTSEVQQDAQSAALPSTEPSELSTTTVITPVPAVELPAQESATTFPQPSIGTANKVLHSIPTTTVVLPPAPALQSSPARLLSPSKSTSSIRSTRSQCKYHKITLPVGESRSRVCFLVPGCSLTNEALMKEEEIVDQGEATFEDSLLIQGIEDLDFDQYLIGILRQLVGLDILREGEVFYLPQPGDDVPRKHWPRKSISERISTAKGSDYASFAGSPGYSYSGSARSPSTRPPLSNADSRFTSISAIAATDDESDMTDNQEPSAVTTGDRMLSSKGKRKPRKTKDNALQLDEKSSDEESTQKKRRKTTKRGVKRTRTLDGATENDGTRKSKRLKLHLTDSSLYQAQHYD